MRHFPVFVDLRSHTVVVAGSGETAAAKLRLLLKTEARIVVYGPRALAADAMYEWHAQRRLTWHFRHVHADDLASARLVYAASGDPREDDRVHGLAQARGVLANVVDDLEASDFITPAIVDRDPVVIAIGTEGTAPVLAQQIRTHLEARLSPRLGQLARLAWQFRARVSRLGSGHRRRTFWQRVFGPAIVQAIEHDGPAAAERAIQDLLATRVEASAGAGRVLLVGAGPGDPELLTLKARKALREADVILFDRLVAPEIMDLARREARLVNVGKAPGGAGWSQLEIGHALRQYALDGNRVVRLKSGDPMLFGRADEEIEVLEAAGIAFEVVPGITSAAAASASIGRSLTRRGRNSAVTLISAQDAAGYAEHDWRALSQRGAAFAIYMGVAAARFVQGRLLLHGADPNTPITVVENASRPNEMVMSTTLQGLNEALVSRSIRGPAIILAGICARSADIQRLSAETGLSTANLLQRAG